MSAERPKAAKAGEFAMDLLASEEMDRIEALSDAEVESELRDAGIDPARARTIGREALDKAAHPGIRPVPLRRVQRFVWIPAAAAMAAAVGIVIARREDSRVVTAPSPGSAWDAGGSDVDCRSLAPEKCAAQLRKSAFDGCASGRWGECERRLDEARRLDPAGESRSDVVGARRAIARKRAGGE